MLLILQLFLLAIIPLNFKIMAIIINWKLQIIIIVITMVKVKIVIIIAKKNLMWQSLSYSPKKNKKYLVDLI